MGRPPLTDRQLDRAEASLRDRPAALAQQFEEWAADPHPDDAEGAGMLLVRASESWLLVGEHERAVDTARRAVGIGDDVDPDARCYLVDALLAAGRLEEADTVARELRRRGDALVQLFVGESYEQSGNLAQAHRWFTMGLTTAERHGDPDDVFRTLLAGRFRVRQQLELPLDEHDDLHTELVVEDLEADGVDVAAEAAAIRAEDPSNPDAFFRR